MIKFCINIVLYTVPFKVAQVKKNEEGLTFLLSHNPFLGKIFIIQTLRRNRIFTHNGCVEIVTLCVCLRQISINFWLLDFIYNSNEIIAKTKLSILKTCFYLPIYTLLQSSLSDDMFSYYKDMSFFNVLLYS